MALYRWELAVSVNILIKEPPIIFLNYYYYLLGFSLIVVTTKLAKYHLLNVKSFAFIQMHLIQVLRICTCI